MRDRWQWFCVAALALGCSTPNRSFDGASSAGSAGLGGSSAGRTNSAGSGNASGRAGSGGSADTGGDAGGDAAGSDAAGGDAAGGDDGSDPCSNVTCSSPDPCHDGPGLCDSSTGKCSYPNKKDNVTCSNVDDNACTADVCMSGVCTAGAAKVCPAPAACHTAGACNTSTGVCSTPNAAEHANCGTNLECLSGTCQCTVTSCPNGCCAGGACKACTPTTLVTRTASVLSLSVVAPQLFFLEDSGSSAVYSMPVVGGTPTYLSYPPPSDSLSTLVADGAYVYAAKFSNNTPGMVGRMPSTGGAFTTITGSQVWEGARLLTNTASVFSGSTLSSSYLRGIPKVGGTVVALVSSIAIDYQHFAVDDTFLYFIGASGTVISRISVAGGDPVTVTGADANEVVKDVALSGTQLAFASNTRVAKVAAAGGTPSPLTSTTGVYALLADSTAVYYFRAVTGTASCASGTDIIAAPINGGALRRLASDPSTACLASPAQDVNAVYWLAGNSIKKASK